MQRYSGHFRRLNNKKKVLAYGVTFKERFKELFKNFSILKMNKNRSQQKSGRFIILQKTQHNRMPKRLETKIIIYRLIDTV